MTDRSERIGQHIGDYRLLRRLGKGSFGTVYLAEHLYEQTPAAVKVLQFPLTSRKHFHDFLTEARTMRLQHSHIVPLLDFGLSRDDLPYLVMEYAAGGTLHERYPRGTKVPWEAIDTYVQALASALQYAHDRRIIHCDVKPENMLLRQDGTVLLSDFGIARIIEQTGLNSAHLATGTPAYTAPEQSQGRPCAASDQYALAVVVYEWISGQLPFQGSTLEVLLQHRMKPLPSLCTICPEVSVQVEEVIFAPLAKVPTERFPTITHFAEAFHRVLQELSGTQKVQPVPDAPDESIRQKEMQQEALSSSSLTSALSPSSMAEGAADLLQSASVQGTQPASTSEANKRDTLRPAPSVKRPRRLRCLFAVLLSLILLISISSESVWLDVAQHSQQHAKSVTATTVSTNAFSATATFALHATATAMANACRIATANGAQFGFDAAHTNWNPCETVINAKNVSKLQLLWSSRIDASSSPTSNESLSNPTVAHGRVYIGSGNGYLYAFNASCHRSCQPLWSYFTRNAFTGNAIYSSPAVANGVVYIGSSDGTFYAFDASCPHPCQPLWSYATGGQIVSSPTVANGIVYTDSYDGKLYAFSATCRSACSPLWSSFIGNIFDSSPTVANGSVYVGSLDGKLYAFDVSCHSDCQPLWSSPIDSSQSFNYAIDSPLTVVNGKGYIGSDDGQFYAFDASCRKHCRLQPLWSYATGNRVSNSPAVANGVVYVGSTDHWLYAFDASCPHPCHPLWSYRIDGPPSASPTVANGVLYVGSGNGNLYAFDAECRSSCRPLWLQNVGIPIDSSLIVANGVVYVSSSNGVNHGSGQLYAFRLAGQP